VNNQRRNKEILIPWDQANDISGRYDFTLKLSDKLK